jgi:hypothetical protein
MLYSVRKSNPESSLFPTVAGHQLQIASAASFFMTLGQGSPPNISGATVTEHEFCPTQSCKNKVLHQYLQNTKNMSWEKNKR